MAEDDAVWRVKYVELPGVSTEEEENLRAMGIASWKQRVQLVLQSPFTSIEYLYPQILKYLIYAELFVVSIAEL